MKSIGQILSCVFTSAIFVGLLALPAMAQDGELQPGLAVAAIWLNVRAEADPGSDLVKTLEPGELVNVLEVDGPWAHIEAGAIPGWSMVRGPTGFATLINVRGPTPAPRGYHRMTYDVESDRVILFGGMLAIGAEYNDTWSYDVATNTWTRMTPAQSPPPGDKTLAYDVASDRAILYLVPFENGQPAKGPSETWTYDLNTDTWSNLDPESGPPPLLGAVMVYDAESDRMILFGGMDVNSGMAYSNETWTFDYDSNAWTQMNPQVRPPGVNFQPMSYDAEADRVILIGSNADEITDDTWLYDYNADTWEMRQTAESPKHRDYSAMVYAAGKDQVILFGEGEPVTRNDTWAYDFDGNTWTQLEPETSPSERGWHAMAYSIAAEQIVLFGGGKSRQDYTLETWLYDPASGMWTQVGP